MNDTRAKSRNVTHHERRCLMCGRQMTPGERSAHCPWEPTLERGPVCGPCLATLTVCHDIAMRSPRYA